jgi:hypothetical protein
MSRERRREQVESWLASGLSCREYARQAQINENTLSWWNWKLRSEGVKLEGTWAPVSEPFVEITEALVTEASRSGADRIEVVLGDITVGIPDRFATETLDRVFALLEVRR